MAEKIGISLDKETLQLCDKYAAQHSRSRSEFIAAAIQKYVSDLELGKKKNIIARELAEEIVKGSEAGVTKNSKGLFRYDVEVKMIIMILMEVKMKQQYNTALYLRFSRDDELKGESGSISTQRDMLTQYCREQNLNIIGEYVDDGWSGTNFDRPSFQRMIDDIEDGKINCVITKDLSRLGRNYILTGQYTDFYFPSKGVRYIAVADGVDTEKGESEIAPFLNILNEMHARQTSKKVKAAMRTYSPCAPIGYKWHPEVKGKLIPDEDTQWIVEKIFDLAAHGVGAAKIRRIFDEEHIPTPVWLNYQRYGTFAHIFEGQPESKRHQWTTAHIKAILSSKVYIGNSIHNKQTAISFKNKKKVLRPKGEWYTIENTHEPIISRELWDQAHAHINSRKRPVKNGETQIFAGLLKCADCGRTLRYMHKNATARTCEKRYYMCTNYSEYGKEKCSGHYIRYDVIYAVVLARLQYWISQVHKKDDRELLQRLLKSGDKQRARENASTEKELTKTEKRLNELDNLFAKMYEDRAKETITERNFAMLSAKYQEEQTQLENKKQELQAKLDKSAQDTDGAEKWLALVRKYTELTELTAPLLNELINKIVVHQAENDENGKGLPVIENIVIIAEIFNTTLDELVSADVREKAHIPDIYTCETAYDIERIKRFDIKIGYAERIKIRSDSIGKIRVILKSDTFSNIGELFKIKFNECSSCLDVNCIKSSEMSKSDAQNKLSVEIILPEQFTDRAELSADVNLLEINCLNISRLEFDGNAKLADIRQSSGSIEFTSREDYDIILDRVCGRLDINQWKAKTVIHISEENCPVVMNNGRKCTVFFIKTEKTRNLNVRQRRKTLSVYRV